MNNALSILLDQFREETLTTRDQGTSFENLIIRYLETEPAYQSLYREVLSYGDWVDQYGDQYSTMSKKDTGIDLMAVTHEGEFHAIQCKNYAPTRRIQKSDIDSFFTASGKSYIRQRIIITTTDLWSDNAERSLDDQNPPVTVIGRRKLDASIIDWTQFHVDTAPVLRPKKTLRPHQVDAHRAVLEGLAEADRGKLIMACGTGKTFTSLKIAESMVGAGKYVLFLVPSLSLLSQTITEWTQESEVPLRCFAVCSDSDVGKHRNTDDDRVITGTTDLEYPATTDAARLADAMKKAANPDVMTVVFSTYHSIQRLNEAQALGVPEFDLIICDEAHRTTGATFEGEDESAFVQVHHNDFIRAKKRLYMTATPRIYGEDAKSTEGVELYSMDDIKLYGNELHVINFSEAVRLGLLVDYKVIVLAIEETGISRRLQDLLRDKNNSLKVDDAAKIVGCWKALSKQGLSSIGGSNDPMRRAVAFCQVIEKSYRGKTHKVSSKQIAEMFGAVVAQYQAFEKAELLDTDPNAVLDPALDMICEAEHVDGSMNAGEKGAKLDWLKEEAPENTTRILSNVRCLSEGVDVPALDAVLFLTARSSQVDVVQSVGRVMRLSPGKELGYVILPVVIPAGVTPEEALNNNQTYRVVWQVLNALRSHDDRFDAMINKLEFNGSMPSKMEVVAVTDKVQRRASANQKSTPQQKQRAKAAQASGSFGIGEGTDTPQPQQEVLHFEVGEIERALYAKIVKKCGNRHHWEDWADDIAKIARTHIDRIQGILENKKNTREIAAFEAFASELRCDLNDSISDDEIIEMLAQHLITQPVFDALFENHRFTDHNPMSVAMQSVLNTLQEHHLDKERDTLESFYESVKMRAQGIESAEGKQRIIVELYDKFFRNAFPRMTERLGIVYTPIEVVDFILHSVEHVLKTEFNSSMADPNVHILDPFTGTGTFITRLLQSGIIPPDKLPHKYKHEIHANEIVLLAYYIAAINIEATYHGILSGQITGREDADAIKTNIGYEPFNGILLTDTFQLNEKPDLVSQMLADNSARRTHQQELKIDVIVGNPPYSAGQTSANDNNANIAYPKLDERIRETYAARSTATNKNALYDSYIRAIRWASDRIQDRGIIGFVTNGGFLDTNTADGLRTCLAEEFSNLYVFHLRGNARTSGERRRKERDNVFGQGTRTPVAVSILVKNPESTVHGQILFHDIGDYLNRDEKLQIIADFKDIQGITNADGWDEIVPDEFGDWLNQRDPNFDKYIVMGSKGKSAESPTIFENYANGLKTNADAFMYNSSPQVLTQTMTDFISFYNSEQKRFQENPAATDAKDFVVFDSTKINWHSGILPKFSRGDYEPFSANLITSASYRPFFSQWTYYSSFYNQRVSQLPYMFPVTNYTNLVISVTGRGSNKEFSTLITDQIPDLEMISKGQCFPQNLYEEVDVEDELCDTSNKQQATSNKQQATSNKQQATRRPSTHSQATHRTTGQNYAQLERRRAGELGDSDHRQGREERLLSVNNERGARLERNGSGSAMLSDVPLRGSGGRSMSEQDKNLELFPSEDEQPKKRTKKWVRRDAITDDALAHFQEAYPGHELIKEDIFYYIYGLLHSEDYREKYADNLAKQLPRIPRVATYEDFKAFETAGRQLAEWHLNYETVELDRTATLKSKIKGLQNTPTGVVGGDDADFYVTKMKFGKKKDPETGKNVDDRSVVIYNKKITIENIPLEAYDYVVNGRSALEWIIDRQQIRTDKSSGITNDPNDWALETMQNAKYPLELFLRIITVSLKTQEIVNALPKLRIKK